MSNDRMLVEFESDHGTVKLSEGIVRKYLVSGNGKPTDQEIVMFLKLCQYQRLNPFLREAYLVKFGDRSPATIITGKDVFTKRAAKSELFNGIQSGVIVRTEGQKPEYRTGKLVLSGEKLVGAWAKVYRKDWDHPIETAVSYDEYVGRKADGSINSQWAKMPATMLEKVAKVQALREAFPEDFQGLYDAAEMGNASDAPLPKIEEKPEEEPEAVDASYEVVDEEPEQKADGLEVLRNDALVLLREIGALSVKHPDAGLMSANQAQTMEKQVVNLKGEGALRAMIKNLERQVASVKQGEL